MLGILIGIVISFTAINLVYVTDRALPDRTEYLNKDGTTRKEDAQDRQLQKNNNCEHGIKSIIKFKSGHKHLTCRKTPDA